jgi:predicted peptidase
MLSGIRYLLGAGAALLIGSGIAQAQSPTATAQTAHEFEHTITRTVHARYLLYLPQAYADPTARWPMIVYLHGGSRRGSDIDRVRDLGLPRLLESRPDFPFVVLSPQVDAGEIWTDTDLLLGLIDQVVATHAIDPERVYLTGHSMGGRGAFYLAYRAPERFAAIAPLSAMQPIQAWAARLKDMPAWVIHGARDEIVPLSASETMVEALRAAGNEEVRFTVLEDRDHFILDTYEDERLYEWFLRHRREEK